MSVSSQEVEFEASKIDISNNGKTIKSAGEIDSFNFSRLYFSRSFSISSNA